MERSQTSQLTQNALLLCHMNALMVMILKHGAQTEHVQIVGDGQMKISHVVSYAVPTVPRNAVSLHIRMDHNMIQMRQSSRRPSSNNFYQDARMLL